MSQYKYAEIADTVYFWFAANTTAGTAGDGASPLYDVRLAGAAAAAAATASGTPTLLTSADYTDGLHEIAIDTTGYAAGEYAVFCTLTISAVNPAGFCGSFLLRTAGTAALDVNIVSQDNIDFGATQKASINTEVDNAIITYNLDHLCLTATAGADMTTEVADNTILSRVLANGNTSDFNPATDGLQPIRDRGDAEWITAVGFAVAGDAMNLAADAIKAVSYDESTAWPITASDAGATQIARVGADGDTLETLSDQIDLQATLAICTEARLAELDAANLPTDIADIPTVAEFEARTIVSADYVVVGDTIARVTLVDTTTTNTDLVTAATIVTAMEADGGDLSSLMEALVNKLLITELTGDAQIFNDAGAPQGIVLAAFTSVANVTQRKRIFI